MPDQYYDSKLTGEQLDAAFLQVQNIQQTASQVQSNATAAAQSASQASQSASSASRSASQASTSAQSASESQSAAASSASSASESAKDAAASASSIEDDVATSAANARAAQQAASDASASAAAAEDAATRAEQIADFDPSDFATAAQGALAESAVQSVNGKSGTAVTLTPADIGAATAAQGAKADTAVQPATLASYALKSEVPTTPADIGAATAAQGTKADSAVQSVNSKSGTVVTLTAADVGAATAAQGAKADTAVQSVNGAKPDSSGNVQLDLTTGTVRSVNGKDPDGSGNVQLSAGDVGAATAAQGAKADTALQPGALNGYAQTSDIPSKLPNPQALGIQLGSGGSVTSYDGSVSRTVAITPEAIGAQPAGAGGAGGTSIVTGETKTFNWENGKTHEELIQIYASFSFAFISLVLSDKDAFAFLQNARGNVGFIASEAQAVGGTTILDVVGYNGSGIDLTGCKIQYMYIPSE